MVRTLHCITQSSAHIWSTAAHLAQLVLNHEFSASCVFEFGRDTVLAYKLKELQTIQTVSEGGIIDSVPLRNLHSHYFDHFRDLTVPEE